MLKLIVTCIELANANTTGRKSSCKFFAYTFGQNVMIQGEAS